ncbi:hypothetical protein CTRI78_v010525 [Colletotrichum trifolii]|uniref:Uncharacterized protein n=1 Tax=Colletotrichum trifolii TaxID=5466 RepID=A0A4R8QQE2_COLTR|nr:hypothetical protein CTRI78_v012101 [Colletotrichum trifolii]TDZ39545.1 hypothetical protein CTRI78_v010524 [Colletotrichum trifolii]TDZ39546.1 hypothetical protein CTRI78_v010525 [Colletotrichum trifolii]
MVARLKLKEIDGRAPPGVNSSRSSSAPDSEPVKGPVVSPESLVTSAVATSPNCGKPSKGGTPKQRSKETLWRRRNGRRYGDNVPLMRRLAAKPLTTGKVQRLDGDGWRPLGAA